MSRQANFGPAREWVAGGCGNQQATQKPRRRQLLFAARRLPRISVPILAAALAGGCASTGPAIQPSEPFSSKATPGEPVLIAEPAHVAEAPAALPAAAPALPVLPVEPAAEPTAAMTRERAVALLVRAMDSPRAELRAHAIEGLQAAPDSAGEPVRRGLVDENRGVRFAAAMTMGQLSMGELTHLLHPLLSDPSGSVRAAAIYALRRNGVAADVNPLAAMLFGDDPEEKANAALILGELGNRSAISLLERALGRGLSRAAPARVRLVDLQIAEALVKLGAEEHLDGIRAALYAPPEQGELTALACLICGRLEDGRVAGNLEDLATRTGERQQSPEVRMAATAALARIDPSRVDPSVPLAYVADRRPERRAQAAMTLGAIEPDRLDALTRLLSDSDPLVQVAAAAAILRVTEGEQAMGRGDSWR